MNKSDLIQSVIDNVHLKKKKKERQQYLFPEYNYDLLPRKKAKSMVNSLVEIMITMLEKGDKLLLAGFGRFSVEIKSARNGRNPQTGEKIFINSKRVVKFRSFKRLKERVNK